MDRIPQQKQQQQNPEKPIPKLDHSLSQPRQCGKTFDVKDLLFANFAYSFQQPQPNKQFFELNSDQQ